MQASMLVQKCAAKRTTLVPVLVTVLVFALIDMPGALSLCSRFAAAGHVLCICDGGLDGGGEVSKREISPITPVLDLEGLSRRLP